MAKSLTVLVRLEGFPSARSGQAHFATREFVPEGLEFQNEMVRLEGFGPPACGLEVRCSIQLSYRRKNVMY